MQNFGNIYLEDKARLFLQNNAYLQNQGVIDISKYSMFDLQANSTLENYKNLNTEGVMQCYENASIENNGIIMLNNQAMLLAYDDSYLDNQKNLENSAAIVLLDQSKIDNTGNLTIKKTGSLRLNDYSLAKNKGTWRNIGIFDYQEASFINDNIYFDDKKLGAH